MNPRLVAAALLAFTAGCGGSSPRGGPASGGGAEDGGSGGGATPAVAWIELAPMVATLGMYGTQQFTATAHYDDGTTADVTASVSWSSSDPAVATVAAGLVTAAGVGPASIRATDGASGRFTSAALTVQARTLQRLTISPPNPVVAKGSTLQLRAVGSYSDGTTEDLTGAVDWSTPLAGVANVGNATGTKGRVSMAPETVQGQVIIQVTEPVTGFGNVTTLTMVDTAFAATPAGTADPGARELRMLTIGPPAPVVAKGATLQLAATALYSDGTSRDVTEAVAWEVTPPGAATVGDEGGTKGRLSMSASALPGQVFVKATDPSSGLDALVPVSLAAATLSAIRLEPATATLAKGSRLQLTALAIYSDGTQRPVTDTVTWSTSSEEVASVGNSYGAYGTVTGQGPGGATVTALDPTTGKSATAAVTGTEPALASIAVGVPPDTTLWPDAAVLPAGFAMQLTATGTFTDGSTQDLTRRLEWSAADPAVATVANGADSKGLATAVLAGGSTDLVATDPATGKSGKRTLRVTSPLLQDFSLPAGPVALFRWSTAQLQATGRYSDDSTRDITSEVTWRSSDTSVADFLAIGGTPKGLLVGLGDGTTTITATVGGASRSMTVEVTVNTSRVQAVARTGNGAIALKEDGTVWTWGDDSSGQLGAGFTHAWSWTPFPRPWHVNGLPPVTKVAGGDMHVVALAADGTVWTWGNNYYGELGTGDRAYHAAPVKVGGLSGVVDVAAGGYHSVALRADGTVWTWGNNGGGQLGDGTREQRESPVQVVGLGGVKAIAAGSGYEQFTVALAADGTVWTWGANASGELGNGTATPLWNADPALDAGSLVPVQALVSGVKAISAGAGHVLALRTDGTVWAWGSDSCGQTGYWRTGWCGNHQQGTPAPVPGLSGVSAVAAGEAFSAVVLGDGRVMTWGLNAGGLGRGGTDWPSYDMHETPVAIPHFSGVVQLSAMRGVITLRSDGSVWSWGRNDHGQIGDGSVYDVALVPTQALPF